MRGSCHIGTSCGFHIWLEIFGFCSILFQQVQTVFLFDNHIPLTIHADAALPRGAVPSKNTELRKSDMCFRSGSWCTESTVYFHF